MIFAPSDGIIVAHLARFQTLRVGQCVSPLEKRQNKQQQKNKRWKLEDLPQGWSRVGGESGR